MSYYRKNFIKKIFVIIFLFSFCRKCCAKLDFDYDFYSKKVEPILDVICENVMREAERIVITKKPSLEIMLTKEERHYSKDDMEFFGSVDEELREQYSGVLWRAVWFDGKTLIEGWAKADKKFHANSIYTIDTEMIFRGGIAVGKNISILEKFFSLKLGEISYEKGIVGHLETIYANDNVFAVCVFIKFNSKNIITQIKAFNNNVYDDAVPVVPNSSQKINDFVEQKTKELDFYSDLYNIEDNIGVISSRIINDKYQYVKEIVLYSLFIGIVISIFLCIFLKIFVFHDNKNSYKPICINDSSLEQEAEVIDAILVDENEVRKPINEYTRKTFLSKITLIEKIFICLGLLNIVLLSLTLSGFIQPLEYMSIQESREIIKSSVLALCAWFSVRYSFHMASQVTGKGFTKFLKFIGIFICLFIFWAHGKGYF